MNTKDANSFKIFHPLFNKKEKNILNYLNTARFHEFIETGEDILNIWGMGEKREIHN